MNGRRLVKASESLSERESYSVTLLRVVNVRKITTGVMLASRQLRYGKQSVLPLVLVNEFIPVALAYMSLLTARP